MRMTQQSLQMPEPDLIDRIADALPENVRSDYYREMRHCRALPENDEMLRILRVMQFLTLLMEQVPGEGCDRTGKAGTAFFHCGSGFGTDA